MQDEQSWIISEEDDSDAAKKYQYFMSKEPRDDLGPIQEIDDPIMGRTKVRDVRIGMVRNAASGNKKDVLAYLSPFPHIRIDDAKPLQGWYQSKVNESKQSRPRPCLLAGSMIATPAGPRPIELVQKGDTVWGVDLSNGQRLVTTVEGTTTQTKAEYLELILEDGRVLRLTPEHQVYTKNRGWVEAQHLVETDELLEVANG